jgi:hypothetical protein
MTKTHRPLAIIAAEIRKDWAKVNYAAAPYLDALRSLDQVTDQYGADSGEDMILYFLSNATTWRGEKAKAIKAELKQIAGLK